MIAFLAGLLIGVWLGLLTAALCVAAAARDRSV